ncbi:hypothetical protein BJ912DRAFT_945984 [Pholiota molesta]|nr:hypothetical protein BJ912DRAFT_945984 [Pholiota molesta]
MSTTRLHPHHSLPAPVVHATFSDAYWSDDEAEDAECPLCLEEMDISDLNFKPCICGYQICRFCWHHIKENLNKRCPACRRVYTDDAVEFKPIATQDHKRLTQQKKQRDRERKDLEMLGRKHLANVRVVQRNVVYVVGIGPRFAKEELIPTLRSNEYFGQYGKITKILLVKRTSSGGGPVVGLYITYHRREDAARAIAAVDGTPSPGGGRDPMRASYGTTKYCMAFLRGVQCSDHSCMNLHEWGDEKDCFTKEDLTTLKHTMKATESRTRTVTTKKADEDAGLPRAASWAQKGSTPATPSIGSNASLSPSSNVLLTTATTTPRQTRRTAPTRLPRNAATTSMSTTETRVGQVKTSAERKTTASRPSTPAIADASRAEIAAESKALKVKEVVSVPESTSSPAPSATTASDDSRPESTESMRSNARPLSSKPSSNFLAPPGLSAPPGLATPPGLAAPPGISTPSRPPRAETTSPQTPLLASQSSYQISNTARALIDDFKARTVSALPASSASSPFPDFDRTLQTLSGGDGGGFSFNLDPKLADEVDSTENLSDFDSSIPFHGSYVDAFPALRTGSPYMQSPSLGYSHPNSHSIYDPSTLRVASASLHEKQNGKGTSYLGSFNPFSDTTPDNSAQSQRYPHSPVDDERKVSRFGFARGRQSSTATSSPLHSVTPLTYGNDLQAFFHSSDEAMHSWPPGLHDLHISNSHTSSPLAQQAQAQPAFGQQPRLQSLNGNGDLSEAQLRNFILSSQERENSARNLMDSQQNQFRPSQHFEDPAIMSASFAAPTSHHAFASMAYGPPPGLPVPQRLSPSPAMVHNGISMDDRISSTQVLPVIPSTPPTFYSEDFPALAPSSSDTVPVASVAEPIVAQEPSPITSSKSQEKAERKAAKKAAAAEKAIERQRIAAEKAEAKAAEKAKIAKAKAAEKEREKEKEREEQEKASLLIQLEAESPKSPLVVQTETAAQPDKSKHAREENPVVKPGTPKRVNSKPADTSAANKRREPSAKSTLPAIPLPKTPISPVEFATQVPLLSKKPKKNKPISKPIFKAPPPAKEEDAREEASAPSATDPTRSGGVTAESTPADSRSHSVDRYHTPTSVQELLEQIDAINPGMDLSEHPFFDVQKLTSPAKMPLEYGPLVHALSALSVGGGSFANNMPSGSIDNAVSSFQQLLETLTQTISDLLRLLPRTTWDDSSSFDGVLRDMLKGDDFLDDGEEGPGKDDEVAALTLALERRARWMEVQLSKLEELHRDINTAAVRAVLSFNDSGWDRHGFLPKIGNTLRRFDNIGVVADNGGTRVMSADELEKKLAVAKEAAIFAETEIREAMERFQIAKH